MLRLRLTLAVRRGGKRGVGRLVLQGAVVDGVARGRVRERVRVDGVHVVGSWDGGGEAGELGGGGVPVGDGGGGFAGGGFVFEGVGGGGLVGHWVGGGCGWGGEGVDAVVAGTLFQVAEVLFEHVEETFFREGFGEDVVHAWEVLVMG